MTDRAGKSIQIIACSTCGKTVQAPGEIMENSYPTLPSIAYQKLSNPDLLVGAYRKPLKLNFLHVFADVECPECGDKAHVEVRL